MDSTIRSSEGEIVRTEGGRTRLDRPWRRPGAVSYALRRLPALLRPPARVYEPATSSLSALRDLRSSWKPTAPTTSTYTPAWRNGGDVPIPLSRVPSGSVASASQRAGSKSRCVRDQPRTRPSRGMARHHHQDLNPARSSAGLAFSTARIRPIGNAGDRCPTGGRRRR